MKCKDKRDFDGEATDTNGRRMAKGICPVCGTKDEPDPRQGLTTTAVPRLLTAPCRCSGCSDADDRAERGRDLGGESTDSAGGAVDLGPAARAGPGNGRG